MNIIKEIARYRSNQTVHALLPEAARTLPAHSGLATIVSERMAAGASYSEAVIKAKGLEDASAKDKLWALTVVSVHGELDLLMRQIVEAFPKLLKTGALVGLFTALMAASSNDETATVHDADYNGTVSFDTKTGVLRGKSHGSKPKVYSNFDRWKAQQQANYRKSNHKK